jgi:hypothetical protein
LARYWRTSKQEKETAINQKGKTVGGKKEKIGEFLSINPYKIEIMQKEEVFSARYTLNICFNYNTNNTNMELSPS